MINSRTDTFTGVLRRHFKTYLRNKLPYLSGSMLYSRPPTACGAADPELRSQSRRPASPGCTRRTGPPRPSYSAVWTSPCPRGWEWWSGWECCPSWTFAASAPVWPGWWRSRCGTTRRARVNGSPAAAEKWPRTPTPVAAIPRFYSASHQTYPTRYLTTHERKHFLYMVQKLRAVKTRQWDTFPPKKRNKWSG